MALGIMRSVAMQPNALPHDAAQGFDVSKRFTAHRPIGPAKLRTIDPTAWADKPLPDRKWRVEGVITDGTVSIIAGDGGLGKSTLAMQLLASSALGKPWLGIHVPKAPAVGVFAEDDVDELHRRLYAITTSYGSDLTELKDLTLLSRVGLDNALADYPQDRFNNGGLSSGEPTLFHSQLMNLCLETGAKILVLDSLYDFFGGNEISRLQARKFISICREIATEMDGAVIITSHPSHTGRNTGTGESGSTAWGAAVRSRLYLRSPKEDSGADVEDYRRELEVMKNNYGKSGNVWKLRWKDGVFVREDQPGGFEASIAKRKAEDVFLDLLARSASEGRDVSESRNAGNYAPKFFSRRPDSTGFTKSDFTAAMERLFADKKIRVEHYGRAGDSRKRIVAVHGQWEDVPFEV